MSEMIVTLLVQMSTLSYVHLMVDFTMVKIPSTYNAVLERPTLGLIQAVCSPYYLKVKFSTANGIGKLLGHQFVVCNYYIYTMKVKESFPTQDLDQRKKVWQKRM